MKNYTVYVRRGAESEYDKVNGIKYVVNAVGPKEAVIQARRAAEIDGHAGKGKGQLFYKAELKRDALAEVMLLRQAITEIYAAKKMLEYQRRAASLGNVVEIITNVIQRLS